MQRDVVERVKFTSCGARQAPTSTVDATGSIARDGGTDLAEFGAREESSFVRGACSAPPAAAMVPRKPARPRPHRRSPVLQRRLPMDPDAEEPTSPTHSGSDCSMGKRSRNVLGQAQPPAARSPYRHTRPPTPQRSLGAAAPCHGQLREQMTHVDPRGSVARGCDADPAEVGAREEASVVPSASSLLPSSMVPKKPPMPRPDRRSPVLFWSSPIRDPEAEEPTSPMRGGSHRSIGKFSPDDLGQAPRPIAVKPSYGRRCPATAHRSSTTTPRAAEAGGGAPNRAVTLPQLESTAWRALA